jgi:cytochrome c oxidase cbb3-type subunit 4
MSNASGILSGLFTALLILVFIGIGIWAWSARRKESFEQAARLPLEEDSGVASTTHRQQQS